MANIEKLSREYGKVIWTGKKCILGMPISFTRYILTETRLITRVGLLNLREDEVELYRVFDKSVNLSFGQRIVGCGTIKLLAKDSDTPVKEIKSIKKPREVKRVLDEAIHVQRDRYMVRGRDMVGVSVAENDLNGNGVPDDME